MSNTKFKNKERYSSKKKIYVVLAYIKYECDVQLSLV